MARLSGQETREAALVVMADSMLSFLSSLQLTKYDITTVVINMDLEDVCSEGLVRPAYATQL